jgi:hypothetical protein
MAIGCSAAEGEPGGRACRVCRSQIDLNGTTNRTDCLLLSSYMVTPRRAPVGYDIILMATVGVDAGAVTITWTGDRGSIASPHATDTTLRCTEGGAVLVTLTAATATCSDVNQVHVSCVDCADGGAGDPACPKPPDGGASDTGPGADL